MDRYDLSELREDVERRFGIKLTQRVAVTVIETPVCRQTRLDRMDRDALLRAVEGLSSVRQSIKADVLAVRRFLAIESGPETHGQALFAFKALEVLRPGAGPVSDPPLTRDWLAAIGQLVLAGVAAQRLGDLRGTDWAGILYAILAGSDGRP
ncbi:MAG: hypothetical protein LC118_01440 [Dehalococcoidia bacterium]|nr:hypothetical protein [Dehalococcoidia bacterium]